MSSEKKNGPVSYSKADHSFQQEFLSSLQTLSNPSKRKIALQDLKDTLKRYADSPQKVNSILSLISDLTENPQKSYSKPEALRALGVLSEVLQGRIIEFTPKIQQIILSSLSQDDPELHDSLKDVIGKLTKYVLGRVDPRDGSKEVKNILKGLWRACRGTGKYTQMGAALCISEVIQTSKREILRDHVELVASKVVRLIRKPECRAKFELLKCLMSLIVAMEDSPGQLKGIADISLPSVVENIESRDWNVKKLSFTVIRLLAESAGEAIAPYKRLLMEAVNECKYDKLKEVQDIASSTFDSLKNLKDVPQEKVFMPRKSAPRSHSRSAQKERLYTTEKQDLKDYERKRPGILKDSSYDNSPIYKSTQGLLSHPLKKTMNEKMELGPFSAKNQRSMKSESSLAQFYTPNGMLTNQLNYYPSHKENEVSNFEVKYAESHYVKRPEQTYAKESEHRTYTPSTSGEKNTKADSIRSPQIAERDLYKHRKAETSSDEVSTRQFTGDMDREGSKKSNTSSPMHPSIPNDSLAEILSQLSSINHSQNLLKQGVDSLRLSTQDELSFLKSRLNQLEGLVGKLCTQQKETSFSTRTSAIFSDYNPFKTSQSQFYGKLSEDLMENGREIDRPMGGTLRRYQEMSEKGRKSDDWDIGQETERKYLTRKDSSGLDEAKSKKPLFGMKLEECLKKKAFTEAYKLCLEEGDEDVTIYLMKETGPVIEKLKGNLGEILLNQMKTKLFDPDSRAILLDWIERALFARVEISRGTVAGLKGILGQIQKYHRDPHDRENDRVQKVYEYLIVLSDTLEGSESKKEERV